METYIGTKVIEAKPCTREDAEKYHGVKVGGKETGDGYLVSYDQGRYFSWSPKAVFNKVYRATTGLNFGLAVEAAKKGEKIARTGWNGKGMFVFLVPGSKFNVNRAPLNTVYPEGTPITYRDHLDMKTADGSIVPWLASQTDVLADDWQIVVIDGDFHTAE